MLYAASGILMSSTNLAPAVSELSQPTKSLRQVANASAWFPLCALAMLYGQWALSGVVLGHEPRVSLDDPKGVAWVHWLHPVTGCMLIALRPAMLVAVVANLLYAKRSGRAGGNQRLLFVAAIAGWTLLVLAMDPGDVLQWRLD